MARHLQQEQPIVTQQIAQQDIKRRANNVLCAQQANKLQQPQLNVRIAQIMRCQLQEQKRVAQLALLATKKTANNVFRAQQAHSQPEEPQPHAQTKLAQQTISVFNLEHRLVSKVVMGLVQKERHQKEEQQLNAQPRLLLQMLPIN